MVRYYIGTSGWHYDDWRGRFYPENLPKSKWLGFYTRHFSTLELNNTFYHTPTEKALASWYNVSPADFVFAVKANRFITHTKRLKGCKEAVDNILSKVALLKDKLGPLLFQLPPDLRRDDERLQAFLALLPRECKYAVEFRHKSWFEDEVYDILRYHEVGFCIFTMPKLTSPIIVTADFAYIRFHGSDRLYSSKYSDEEMADWAKQITNLAKGRKAVYIYFNNDVAGFALENAATIKGYLENEK